MSFIGIIEGSIENIEINYAQFNDYDYDYDGMSEYTAIIHKKLLKEVIGLFKVMVKSPDLFILEFSTSEMGQIAGMAEKLSENQYDEYFLNDDSCRSLISRMRAVFGEKEALQYKSEVDKLQESMVRVEDMLKKEGRISAMKDDMDYIRNQTGNIIENQRNTQRELEGIQNKNAKVDSVLESVKSTHADIDKKAVDINGFFEKMMENREHIKKLEEENTKFRQEMEENEKKYKEEREGVLETAKNMLGLANAAGLAEAFNQRIDKEEKKNRRGWLAGAFISITVTMGTAIFLFFIQGGDITLTGTLARMSITAIPFLVAWFCGAQYLKLERTLEDYEYKKALAQSMPAFMKQLGEGDGEYRRAYLLLAFQQMLQDPLRKKHDVPSPLKDLFNNAIERFSKGTSENKTPKDTTPENKDDKL